MDCYAKLVQGSLSDRKDAIFKVWETHKCMLSMATCWSSTEASYMMPSCMLSCGGRSELLSAVSFTRAPFPHVWILPSWPHRYPYPHTLSPEVSLGEKISTWRFWEVKHTYTVVCKSRKENKYINVDKTKSQSSGGRCHDFWLPSPCDLPFLCLLASFTWKYHLPKLEA